MNENLNKNGFKIAIVSCFLLASALINAGIIKGGELKVTDSSYFDIDILYTDA